MTLMRACARAMARAWRVARPRTRRDFVISLRRSRYCTGPRVSNKPRYAVGGLCLVWSWGPRAVLNLHLCVRRSGVLGVEMKTALPVKSEMAVGLVSVPMCKRAINDLLNRAAPHTRTVPQETVSSLVDLLIEARKGRLPTLRAGLEAHLLVEEEERLVYVELELALLEDKLARGLHVE